MKGIYHLRKFLKKNVINEKYYSFDTKILCINKKNKKSINIIIFVVIFAYLNFQKRLRFSKRSREIKWKSTMKKNKILFHFFKIKTWIILESTDPNSFFFFFEKCKSVIKSRIKPYIILCSYIFLFNKTKIWVCVELKQQT